ncbi:threonine/serine ThrE exporter family protein [Budvicia diplopodorum]|uniref:threonine/serine ThrE exporter family protein n=1 Tax=Budvicia diplopodorum TaxID=1119056 RepID=UPI00135C00ED|nr:threonine/serine exporter ThrE family protein [Budvicia diplopodorum]
MESDKVQLRQREITRLCIQCALLLLQHGAESMLVEQLSYRLGKALGIDNVESSISANAVVLSTIYQGFCMTSTRKNIDRGINMHMVTEVQRIVILTEHRLLDIDDVQKRLDNIKPLRYPRWLMVLMVGLSCASFCKLAGGSWDAVSITFVASSIAMYARQLLTSVQMNPLINFFCTAFVATTVAGWLVRWIDMPTASVAMASSVLLLVPGFPLINSVADMFKGHINTGIARWAMASLLTLSTCIGVVVAMSVWGFRSWL